MSTPRCPTCKSAQRLPTFTCHDHWHYEGVAAPLEPSQFTAEDFHNSREWVQHQPQSDRECLTEDGYWLAFAEMYAAAVSKNSEERMQRTIDLLDSELGESVAETKAAEARILELEKEIAALRETK
jgi:hypothetical protein